MKLALFLFLAISASGAAAALRDPFVEARHLPRNEISFGGVVRIHTTSLGITVPSPLTADVLAYDAKGTLLPPGKGPFAIDWMSESPVNETLDRGVIAEIRIGTYRCGPWIGSLPDAIYRYDVRAIAAVKLSFTVQLAGRGEHKVVIDLPPLEVRRLIGLRAGG